MITTREQLEQAIESEVERNEEDNSDYLSGWWHCVTESDLSYFEDQVQKIMDSYEPRSDYFNDIDLKASDVVTAICKDGSWEMIARSWMHRLDNDGLIPMWSQQIGECPLYTSEAADEEDSVEHGGCRTTRQKHR